MSRGSVSRSRVLLVGYGPTTQSALECLRARFELVALVRDTEDSVTGAARAWGVPVSIGGGEDLLTHLMSAVRPDCVVVSSYNRILSPSLLARRPFVNVHYAPLPQYRGRANVNWAILNDESAAAVTVHSMVPGLDAGGVLAQESVPIGVRDDVGRLYQRLHDLQSRLLPAAVERRLAGDLGDPQDESQATYGCTRVPDDGLIDWSLGTAEIDRLVRALSDPYPGAFTFLGLDRLGVLTAEPAPPRRFVGRVPGRVVASSVAEGWTDVLTGDGVLRLRLVRHHGHVVPAPTVLRGTKQTLGLRQGDLVSRLVELEARVAEAESALAQELGSRP